MIRDNFHVRQWVPRIDERVTRSQLLEFAELVHFPVPSRPG